MALKISPAHMKAWEDKLREQVLTDFKPGHPFYSPPLPPPKFHQRVLRRVKWVFGLRIVHKDRIDREEW